MRHSRPDLRPGPARLVPVLLAVALALGACTSTGPDATPTTPPGSEGMFDGEGEVGSTTTPRPDPSPPPLHESVDSWPARLLMVDPGEDGELLPVEVRVADTPERRSHGLMEVPEVPDGVGMWFTYSRDQTGGFWMRGTLTDLDIAWVDDSGRIVAIRTMTACDEDPCPTYEPGASYRNALEVRAGWFADNGVEVDDRILAAGGGADSGPTASPESTPQSTPTSTPQSTEGQ